MQTFVVSCARVYRARVLGVLAACAAAAAPALGAITGGTITNIGVIPGGSHGFIRGLSGDGSTVAATGWTSGFQQRAVMWTSGGGLVNLGVHPSSTISSASSRAEGISADGSVIVGQASVMLSSSVIRAMRYTAGGGFEDLGNPLDSLSSSAADANGDGSVVVGTLNINRAFRWTSATGMVDIGNLPGATTTNANAVSDDGNVITGISGGHAFHWTSVNGMVDIGTSGVASQGLDISNDGNVIVGSMRPLGSGDKAFRWTSATGMVSLGFLPGGNASFSLATNEDGSVIVGRGSAYGSNTNQAFMWTQGLGMVDLNVYLPSVGVDLTGWTLREAQAVSADGLTLAGTGLFNGSSRGWIVTLVPTPGTFAVLGLGALASVRRRR